MSTGELRREVVGGVTTFLTMSYIIVVNPSILATEGTGMPLSGVMTATVLLAMSTTILMGLWARLPFAVAPGMGLNAFFTFQLVLGQQVPWRTALGIVVWSGVAFLLVSATSLRQSIARTVPAHLRIAAAAGIGLLLAFIGLRAAGIVAPSPATFVTVGHLGAPALVFGVGLVVTIALLVRGSAFALIGGIVLATLAGALVGQTEAPERIASWPDLSLVGKADLVGALRLVYLPALLAMLLMDLFDSLSTFVGVAHATGLVDEQGEPKNLGRGLFVDAIATTAAGLLGTSAGTAYIESAAGIRAGGRTGMTAVVCGLCFAPFLLLGPLAAVVPPSATAPALFAVGVFMFRGIRSLPTEKLEEAVPAYATLLLIPLTSSIAQGILWGFVLHVVCFTLAGRAREVTRGMWLLALVAAGSLWLENPAP